jgi:methylamine dehydrogenase heavy chain
MPGLPSEYNFSSLARLVRSLQLHVARATQLFEALLLGTVPHFRREMIMRSPRFALAALCVCVSVSSGAADSPFRPQHLTVKAAIDPGPNVFTTSIGDAGAGSINVFSATDLKFKGSMTTGSMGQTLIARDGKTAYTTSVYMKRISYGDPEFILQVYDVATLSPTREIALPPKLAMVDTMEPMLAQSADGRLVYVQNATPATSITVVDVTAGKVTGEIPAPGCFGIYPSLEGHKFSAICGDGTFASFTLNADETSAGRSQSKKIFDVDKDPIFVPTARVGTDFVFVSFHGNVYRVSDSGPAIKLVDRYSVTDGVDPGWAPGGAQLMAYNKANDVLFIGMHPDAKEGSHKTPAKEIWAYNLRTKKLLYRSPVDDVSALTASDAPVPAIYAASKAKMLFRLEVDPEAKFALKKSQEVYNPGTYNSPVILRP